MAHWPFFCQQLSGILRLTLKRAAEYPMNRLAALTLTIAALTTPPLLQASERGQPIPGHYIVELDLRQARLLGLGSLDQTVNFVLSQVGGGLVTHRYRHALTGFSVQLPPEVVPLLRALPIVKHVEQDQVVTLGATQVSPIWGLDRIDQRNLPLDSAYTYRDSAGQGTHVYVVDTGIRASHQELSGRVGNGRNFAPNSGSLLFASTDPANTNDCNGHGTHVAGTVAGTQYGVAKRATVYPVRVLGCNGSGSNSGVIAGVDWITANHRKPAVANLSLGGGDSASLDNAVRNAIAAGVTFVVAAGNDNRDACTGSPNRVAEALTVAASDNQDRRSSFSNHGPCVDLFAPGTGILSAYHNSDSQTATLSGTSMAAPHVAGAAALLLSAQPTATPAQVESTLLAQATAGVISNVNGAPNRLLYVRELGGDTGSLPLPPPEPTPETPCSACTSYTLTLSGGQSGYAPGTAGFSFGGGMLKGYLRLPAGLDAELYLEQQQRSLLSTRWVTVASVTGSAMEKNLSSNVSNGTYRWRIRAVSGSGQARFFGEPR